jgi:hypothetical protein
MLESISLKRINPEKNFAAKNRRCLALIRGPLHQRVNAHAKVMENENAVKKGM